MAKIPSYKRQKRKGGPDLAFAQIGSRKFYFGPYDSQDSIQAYQIFLAEYNATGMACNPNKNDHGNLSIMELCDLFICHVESYYLRPDGTQTGEIYNFKKAVSDAAKLYGHLPVDEFGPRKLKAIRQKLIDQRLSRSHINATARRIRRMFRWELAEELVKPETVTALDAVEGLRKGRKII